MFPLYLYLVALIIAPSLWIPPFIGWPTDYIIYPMIMLGIVATGRIEHLVKVGAYEIIFGLLFCVVLIGAVLNGMSPATQEQVILYFKFFLLYKLTYALVADSERAQKFFRFFNILVLILAVEAIQQKISADGSGWANQGRAWIDPDVLKAGGVGRSRWIGIFDGPGVFCVLFTITLPLLFPMLDKHHPFRRRLMGAALVALILGATYCTGSRGGLLASIAVIGLYVLMKAQVSIRSIVISVVLAVGIYSAAPSYLTTINDQSNSTQYRVEMWAAGLDMIKEKPLFGIGRGNFAAYTNKLIAHNSAVQMGGETGLIGLFLWIALLYLSIKGVAAYWKGTSDPNERGFCVGLILAVVGYLVSAMFVTLEYETFYLLLAICAVMGRRAAQPVGFGMGDIVKIVGIEIVWLIILQAFVILYLG